MSAALREDRGAIAVTVALLLPLLLTTVAGVLQVGALRVIAARIASAADLAVVAAVNDQDADELIRSGRLRLSGDAIAVARRYFALNLDGLAAHLAVSPESAAAEADVAAFTTIPSIDPLTGWRYTHPTVRIAARVPVRTPAFGAPLPAVTLIDVRAASAPR